MNETSNTPQCQHRHLGAYGVCVVDGHILLVRKSRGPYTGLLDLPGGAVEFGEEPEAALRREFLEETGLRVISTTLQAVESEVVAYIAADGVNEELHHVGLIYSVSLGDGDSAMPAAKSDPDCQDSSGAAWFTIRDLDMTILTPFARTVLAASNADAVIPIGRRMAGHEAVEQKIRW